MKDKIEERYEAKMQNVRYELTAYDADSMEAIEHVTDFDVDVVVGEVNKLQERVSAQLMQEATEEVYDVEPAEY